MEKLKENTNQYFLKNGLNSIFFHNLPVSNFHFSLIWCSYLTDLKTVAGKCKYKKDKFGKKLHETIMNSSYIYLSSMKI